jgi:hypothetical protein
MRMKNISSHVDGPPHVLPPCLLKMTQVLRIFLLPFCVIMQALNIYISTFYRSKWYMH